MENRGFDPDVFEFYRPALEGNGFSMPDGEPDLRKMREDEISRHVACFYPYEGCKTVDIKVPREDTSGDPLPLRVYLPASSESCEDPLPVLLYFHGGGFIMGGIEDHDPLCRKLADSCNAVVMSVEYRLAPEYPFPACIEDAELAAEWAYSHAREYNGDRDRMMAGGDSSGANISAVLALLAKEGSVPSLSGLILFYGIYGCIDIDDSVSARLYGQGGHVLPVDSIKMMMDLYAPDGIDPGDIRMYPGRASDLSGMPPSIIVTAEMDPLRDDGEAFASRLREAGNNVECIRMDGMMHGFILYWQRFRKAEELLDRIGQIISSWDR